MNEVVEKKFLKAGKISIKPYVDNNVKNMGLESYNMVVFPGTVQREPLACLEQNGRVRYLNGLDEAAPEVQNISDPQKKAARIKEIRGIVADLEFKKNYIHIDVNDPEFWNKVETYKPNNREIWSQLALEMSNATIVLDPINKVDDLLKVIAIEAGGFPMIAKSLEDCKSGLKNRKWYLDRQIDTVTTQASTTKIKNKALSLLDSILETEPRKLFYVIKLIEPSSFQYKNSTLTDSIYEDLDAYINGRSSESVIKKAATHFIEICELSMQELKIRAMIKDSTMLKLVILKGDGLLYWKQSNVMLGRNPSEVYEYLVNPVNEDVLGSVMEAIEARWSN